MIDDTSGMVPSDEDEGLYDAQKRAMIAELAYSYAKERDFVGGDPIEDWVRAERSLTLSLAGGESRGMDATAAAALRSLGEQG